jgi:hypothetical protein
MVLNDAVIFLKPTTTDANNLKSILINFGTVSGLQTNLHKTSVTSISCSGIDLDSILTNLPVSRATFPLKYLGLPLTTRRLWKLDFQSLIDKAVGCLSSWHDRNLN